MHALDRAVIACDANNYVLNSCLRILENKDGLCTFALSMIHRLGASGDHKANLCFAMFSQQNKEVLFPGKTLQSEIICIDWPDKSRSSRSSHIAISGGIISHPQNCLICSLITMKITLTVHFSGLSAKSSQINFSTTANVPDWNQPSRSCARSFAAIRFLAQIIYWEPSAYPER